MNNYEKNLQTLIGKVEGSIDMGWDEVCDYIGADVHPDSLRKAFATTEYGGYSVAKYLMDKTANELTEDMIASLEKKKVEEYKERVRLQDARREYNKELRAEARYESLREILQEAIYNGEVLFPSNSKFGEKHLKIKDKMPKSAILMLSDWHYGAICDSQWNYYDTSVAKERAEQIINKTIKYILKMGITDLVVEINGDMVEGAINVGNRVASEESVVEQIINVSKLLAKCISTLKPYVQSLKVVTTLGNHGRLTARKKDQADERENFEMLIPEFLRLTLDDDIQIITSQGLDFVKYEFGDKVICLSHGHHDKVNSVLENMVKVYKVIPTEIHLGHYHHASDLNDSDIHIVVNGGLKGIDDFGLKAMRCTTKPSQNLIIYGEDRMVVELVVD